MRATKIFFLSDKRQCRTHHVRFLMDPKIEPKNINFPTKTKKSDVRLTKQDNIASLIVYLYRVDACNQRLIASPSHFPPIVPILSFSYAYTPRSTLQFLENSFFSSFFLIFKMHKHTNHSTVGIV